MILQKEKNGFSLIELLVAISFIAVIISVILTMNVFNSEIWKLNENKTKAYFYAAESLEAIKLVDWTELNNGDWHLELASNAWNLVANSELLEEKYTRTINIAPVERASSENGHVFGEIVESGFVDPDSKKITITISWLSGADEKNVTLETYLSRWQADRFSQSDWIGGSGQSEWSDETRFFNQSGGLDTTVPGIITLLSGFLDWNQATTTANFDLPGNFDENDVYELNNLAYLVTENNSSGSEFYILDVSDIHNPYQIASLNIGSSVTSVVAQGDYAYLSTKKNDAELRVIDISNPHSPYIVASIDLSGNENASDLVVNETELYILQEDDLHSFNISDPTDPQMLDKISLNSQTKELYLSGNNVYVATEDSSQELQIVDVTNPANLQIIGGYNLPGSLKGTDVFVRGTRAYISTENNGSGAEFFIFEISDPTDPVFIGSYEAGEKIHSFAIVGPYALLGTNFLNSELNVIDVSFPSSISEVSSFDLSGNVLGMSANCAVIYAATSSNSSEFFIISTEVSDCGYASNGELESSTFDTGSNEVTYNWISWSGSEPGNTDIKFQIATSNNVNGPWNYLGPDGSSSSYYSDAAGELINYNAHLNQRYFRYKLFLDSQANLQAPTLEEVTISYSTYP
ncbi:prepilin-type N-terminal cleavage/methylation domain-containing protein [Candidatus Nomurabacteria bacterium]|nr:prepilin-type N-terminal cleavage/methylation domain-containing protein [Candidatus Nomurabacteria bacterium]